MLFGQFIPQKSANLLWNQAVRHFGSAPSALMSRANKKEPLKCPLVKRIQETNDSFICRFALPQENMELGIRIGEHIRLSAFMNTNEYPEGEVVDRKYTPVSTVDQKGYFDLLIKIYRRGINEKFPNGGEMTQYIEKMKIGDTIDVDGPVGHMNYKMQGTVLMKATGKVRRPNLPERMEDVQKVYKNLCFIAGGTGIAPAYQILQHIHLDPKDETKLFVLYGNRTEEDIMMKKELDAIARKGRISMFYTLDQAKDNWKGFRGYITEEMIRICFPGPSDDTLVTTCGPKAMNQMVLMNLRKMGHKQENIFKF